MPRYRVELTIVGGDLPFIWEGEARTQYRAEVQAVTALRQVSNQAVVTVTTQELE
jgi:hypothetical protein